VKDEGGELRGLDHHKVNKGHFGRLSRKDGMPLDDAREAAVEAGYLHPDSDINDLIAALRRNQEGNPVFNEGDAGAVEWRAWERARHRGDFEGMPPLPGEPANFDAAAATRYRAAADATRTRAGTFNNPQIGPVLGERGGAYQMAESRVPERFISSPEGVRAFRDAGGDPATLRDALVADLRRSATSADGTLAPTRFAGWQMRRTAALREFPELQQTLGNVAKAQEAVDTVAAQARTQRLDFERGAARHFLNAEPTQAVRSALGSKNPAADMRELVRLASGDPDANAGLQRAVADHLVQKFVSGDAFSAGKAGGFDAFLKQNLALREVFSGDQIKALHNIAADLERSAQKLPAGRTPAPKGEAASLLGEIVAGAGVGGLVGSLPGAGIGATIASLGHVLGKPVVAAMRRAGVENVDRLLTEALLNPEMAQTLLMKASPGNRSIIAQRLASQMGTLAAVGAADGVEERPKRRVSSPPSAPRASAPFNPAMAPSFGSLSPGGALLDR
jgi:hypothetical protein